MHEKQCIYEYIIHKCGQNLLKMGFYPKNDQIPFRPRNIILKYRLYCILPALQHGFNKEINRLIRGRGAERGEDISAP